MSGGREFAAGDTAGTACPLTAGVSDGLVTKAQCPRQCGAPVVHRHGQGLLPHWAVWPYWTAGWPGQSTPWEKCMEIGQAILKLYVHLSK